MRDEAQVIEAITSRFKGGLPHRGRAKPAWLRLGIGNDTALLNLRAWAQPLGYEMALSCDAFLEGVHFLPHRHAAEVVGYKALARATSDLAATGAEPRFLLLTLALPPSRTGRWLESFAIGLARAARDYRMTLVGGDTSAFSTVAIILTVGGAIPTGHALTRSGARAGDQIFVTGVLGAAQLGLELLLRYGRQAARSLLARHLRPQIRLETGQWLAGAAAGGGPRHRLHGQRIASAAIDTSDGLSSDLEHICQSSEVRARIYADLLPLVRVPKGLASRNIDPLELALHGGEDYELLFTVPVRLASRFPRHYGGVPLTRIGEILPAGSLSAATIELVDGSGRARPLEPRGWDSFRAAAWRQPIPSK